MGLFDKRMARAKKESLQMAEDSRQDEWMYPSFVSCLFGGRVRWDIVSPFPEQSKEDKEEGDAFLKRLEGFLRTNLDPDEVDATREIPENVIKGLCDMGVFAIKIPREYGGLGMSQFNYNRVVHLIASYCGSTAALVSAHQSIGVPQPIMLFGTEEQKKKYLPTFRQGAISGFALTEPDAGSDPRMMKTTAMPIEGGKYYLLNGEKLWCTNGNIADVLVVMAKTPPKIIKGRKRTQITAFIVETKTPGFEVACRCKFMGLNAIQNGLLRFNNVKVPSENIILGEGEGLKLAFITLNTGRLTLPAAVTGMSKWCLSVARRWAAERRQWGCSIGEHQTIASKLSNMASTVFTMDAVTWLVVSMADDKRFDIRLEAAMSKLFCTEESWKMVYDAIQIRGGRGYETGPSLRGRGRPGFPLERAMRDSRVNTILEGSSEIMHLFIAREALDFHLKAVKQITDPGIAISKKIAVSLRTGLKYLFWYPGLWIPCFSGGGLSLPVCLRRHRRFIAQTSRLLAREVFHKMLRYQKRLVTRQNILNRFVDIGTELFAMSAVCSYAGSLFKKDKDKKNSVGLADLFCRQARDRIRARFRETSHSHDVLSESLAKKVLAAEYEWLENDIIM